MNMTQLEQAVKALQETFVNLNQKEAIALAIELNRNEILKNAFGVTDIHRSPAFLEGIAMALGYVTSEKHVG